jgi:hypothetical protein
MKLSPRWQYLNSTRTSQSLRSSDAGFICHGTFHGWNYLLVPVWRVILSIDNVLSIVSDDSHKLQQFLVLLVEGSQKFPSHASVQVWSFNVPGGLCSSSHCQPACQHFPRCHMPVLVQFGTTVVVPELFLDPIWRVLENTQAQSTAVFITF